MSELFAAIKMILVSVLVLMFLQIKWEGQTLEAHSEEFVYRSQAGEQIQYVASGLVKASREGWQWVRSQMANAPRSLESDQEARR